MAHHFCRLNVAAALAGVAFLAFACPLLAGEAPGQGARPWVRPQTQGPRGGDHSPEMQNVRRAIESLSPEQRKRFGENMMRWSNLSPEEKKALRDSEAVRQKYIEQEVNMAIAASGLRLEGERRVQFVKRFTEERRKIEEQLRQDMMEKRKPMVRELIGRLKTEFADSKP
jgi:Protein of unknown function (DUF3106)